MINRNSRQMICKSQKVRKCIFASTKDRTLFFQESIDNNKSIGVTIYYTDVKFRQL